MTNKKKTFLSGNYIKTSKFLSFSFLNIVEEKRIKIDEIKSLHIVLEIKKKFAFKIKNN